MPRKPQTTPSERTSAKSITIEKDGWWQQFVAYLHDPRTRIISGILLIALALILLISFISFFFVGGEDQSILRAGSGESIANRREVHNLLGLPGAWLSMALIDGTFGLLAFFFIALSACYGLYLVGVLKFSKWRLFFCSAFWIIWGSILLGFLQLLADVNLFFRWGGAFGQWTASGLNSFVQEIGVTIILLVSLIIFMIIADKQFIDRCEHAWQWLVTKCRKKEDPTLVPEPNNGQDNIDPLDINLGNSPSQTTVEIELNIEGIDNPSQPMSQPQAAQSQTTSQPQAAANGEEIKIEIETVGDHDMADDPGVSTNPETVDAEPIDAPAKPAEADPAATNAADSMEAKAGEAVELAEDDPERLLRELGPFDPRKELSDYQFPSLGLLKVYDNETQPIVDQAEQQANANRIVTTLRNYGVEIDSIKATVGPTVTLYEVVPRAGTKIARIQSLESDIMLALSAIGIRIIAPMPGKGTVGIEVPNEKPQVVSMHSVVASRRFQDEQKMRLPVALGRTITNEVFMFDLAKTPHLLVAGATGQGKSVGLNAIITSLLYKKHPAELKFVLVDPKMVEFSIYKPLLKHYMAAMPDQDDDDIIITDCQKVINTLNSLVIEMEDRYSLLAAANCRNLEDYNEKFSQRKLNPQREHENKVTHKKLHHHYMPYLVIVIDEYGDFIMQAGKEVEHPIQRLAQKARAVGMHLILATQRPDVKIVTGTIKANIPTRIAFRTQSVIDSRTVLDQTGANQLVGKGDLLYSAGGNMTRIQCAFVDTPEVERIVEHVHGQQHYFEPYQLPEYVPENGDDGPAPGSVDMKRLDPMFADVARYVVSKQEGSTSRLQRVFEIGYNRAGKLSDQLEAAGIVGPNKGPKGRDVLIQDMASLESLLENLKL